MISHWLLLHSCGVGPLNSQLPGCTASSDHSCEAAAPRPLFLCHCTVSVHYPKLKEGHRFYEKCHFTADLQDNSDNLAIDMYRYV